MQVNDQNKVPSSALAYSMQQQINETNSNLEEINQELVQTIQQIGGAKFEFGTATTTGATRTIALQGTYTELLYFDLIYTSGLSTFKLRDISFPLLTQLHLKYPLRQK